MAPLSPACDLEAAHGSRQPSSRTTASASYSDDPASSTADITAKKKGRRCYVATLKRLNSFNTKLLLLLVAFGFVFTLWFVHLQRDNIQEPTTAVRQVSSRQNDNRRIQDGLSRDESRSVGGGESDGLIASSDAENYARDFVAKLQKELQQQQKPDASMDVDICQELSISDTSNGVASVQTLVHNNISVLGFVRGGHYAYYQLCIDNSRDYFHTVEIFLDPVAIPAEKGNMRGLHRRRQPAPDVDMYLSTHISRPTIQHSTWITASSGADHIKLTTDLHDWEQKSRVLYIGVIARKGDTPFTIRPLVTKKKGSHRGDGDLIGPDTIHRRARRVTHPKNR